MSYQSLTWELVNVNEMETDLYARVMFLFITLICININETMLPFNFSEIHSFRSSWLQYFPVESVRTTVSFPTVSAFHVIVWPQQFPVS